MTDTENESKLKRAAVAIIRNDEKYLVIKRSKNVLAPGRICFPGGGIEPGESIGEAVVRELREELGVVIQPLKTVWTSTTPWNYEVNWVTAEIVSGELCANEMEVEWFGWMNLMEFAASPDLLSSNADFFIALDAGKFSLH